MSFLKFFASMGGGINTVFKGTAMMGFIKSGIGVVMVFFFLFCSSFLRAWRLKIQFLIRIEIFSSLV